MNKFIIIGHGDVPKALYETARDFFGADIKMSYVCLRQEDSLEDFVNKLKEKIGNDSCLALVDILGGTPFNAAKMLQLENEKIKIITGVNLNMLIQIIVDNNSEIERIVDESKKAIGSY